ncbi:hypothetical protein ABNR98_004460 [Salmonella enterica]
MAKQSRSLIEFGHEKQYQLMDTSELKKELFSTLEATVHQFNRMAEIWRELEIRGENMDELRQGIAIYIEMIAHNQLDANFVVKYAGQKVLLNAVARLPLEEQKKLTESETIEVATMDEDGVFATKQIKLSSLPIKDVYTVFSETGVRPISDQQKILMCKIVNPSSALKRRKAKKIAIDAERNLFQVGSNVADLDHVLSVIGNYLNIDLKKINHNNNK